MLKAFKWFYCLSKRLYKKATFIVLIFLIPVSVAAFSVTTREKTGFVSIALVSEGKDGIGSEVTDKLINDTKSIKFIKYKDKETALAALGAEKIDAVWALPANIEERIQAFVNEPVAENYIAQVYFKENNLLARLPLEKLSGALYPYAARQFYLRFVRENPDFDLSTLDNETIYNYYDGYVNDGVLFNFAFPEDSAKITKSESNYLISPIRGILSVIVVMCGLASAMVFIADEKKGTFSRARASDRVFISLAAQFTAIINIGVFAFVSLFILGVNASFLREAAVFIIFAVNTALFCTVFQQLINSINYFAAVATLLSVLQVIVAPIFFDYRIQRIPQLFLPNTYFINSVHSNVYLLRSLIYTAVLSAILSLFYFKKRRI